MSKNPQHFSSVSPDVTEASVKPTSFRNSLKFIKQRGSRFLSASMISLILLSVFTTAALASIPAADGVISACYDKGGDNKGALRLIDAAVATCKKSETLLTWNQKGIKGDTGPQGAKGDTGPAGAPGAKGDKGDAGPQGAAGAKGDAGPQGLQGIPGVKGDKGDPGMAGISGYEIVSVQGAFDSSSSKSLLVSCPAGKRVLGGGATVFPSLADPNRNNAPVVVRESLPATPTSATEWFASAIEIGSYNFEWWLGVRVICANV